MKTNEILNWSIIFKIKEFGDYLTAKELTYISFNKVIRNYLKRYIFRLLNLRKYEFNFIGDIEGRIDKYPSDILESQFNQLKQDFDNIKYYTEALEIYDNFNHITLLNYTTLIPHLNKLSLDNSKLPLTTLNLILKNLTQLTCLNLVNLDIIISTNDNSDNTIYLPNSLITLIIVGLWYYKVDEIINPLLLNCIGNNLVYQSRGFYTIQSQNLPNLLNLIIPNRNSEALSNINNLLTKNIQTIRFLLISIFNFKPCVFTAINNCSSLTRLQLNQERVRFNDIVEQSEYPEFPYIKHLVYKPRYTGNFSFNKLLLLSFPNLVTLECGFKEELKDDLIFAIHSLTRLEKLTIANRNKEYYFDLQLISKSLKLIKIEGINILQFNPDIFENCSNLNIINLFKCNLKESSITEVEAYFYQYNNWKTIIFPYDIRMYSTSKH